MVLVELSARGLAEQLPTLSANLTTRRTTSTESSTTAGSRSSSSSNCTTYCRSRDDTDYWRGHRDPESFHTRASSKSSIEWQHRCPWHQDERRVDEMFPAASYQYVLYGMGFRSEVQPSLYRGRIEQAAKGTKLSSEVRQAAISLPCTFLQHRQLLEQANSSRGLRQGPVHETPNRQTQQY